jgi:hypothetical protein
MAGDLPVIVYFARRPDGQCYVIHEDGSEEAMDEAMWLEFIRAAAVPSPRPGGAAVRLRMYMQATVDKLEGDVSDPGDDPTEHPAHLERVVFPTDEPLET